MHNPKRYTKLKTSDASRGGGGMACPNCGAAIPVTIDVLLGQGRLQCPDRVCKTVIRLNRAKSGEAIKAMKTLQTDLKAITG